MTKIVATAGLVQVGHWDFWGVFGLHQNPPPPISYSGQLCLQLKLPSSQGLPAELQVALPRDPFISSNLRCQLPAISLCNKVSHAVISERVSGDVAQFKQPSGEGKLRTALSVLVSAFQSPEDPLAPLLFLTDNLENRSW